VYQFGVTAAPVIMGVARMPALPVYNYAREVDYCSGASIMVPKTLFDDLGALTNTIWPAYCESRPRPEDSYRGYRVIYQPLSTVFHFEGINIGYGYEPSVKGASG